MTHTFAELRVSPAAYEEIKAKLLAAGYDDVAFVEGDDPDHPTLDMHGIGLIRENEK